MEAQALYVLDGHACLLGGGRLRPTGALGGQACLGWPRCLLVCGLALLQNGELLSFGAPTYVQQTGFATRGPAAAAPYVGTAALPNLSPKYRDERILSVPHAMRMGAQHMQPSPFGAVGRLKAQIIPSRPSPLEVARDSNIEQCGPCFRQAGPAADGRSGMVHDELHVGVQNANVVIPGYT